MHHEWLAKVFQYQTGFLSILPVLLGNNGLLEPASSLVGCYVWHISSHVEHMKAERMCVLQSCSDAIEEVFDSKLHIIGGVGLAIGVIMVSVDAQKFNL